MKKIMKFILFMIIASFLSLSSGECHGQVLNLQKNISRARESFEDVYYELLKSDGFFNEYYNNNLIINTDLHGDFYQNGIILFKLIEWLQQHDSRDGRFLLKRMNKLFYLEFYRFICKMDQEKTRDGRLFDAFSKIYHHTIPSVHMGVAPVPPFQTTLTKAIILIFTMNSANMYYESKKESLVFGLDAIRQEMLEINTSLGDKKIDEQEIRTLFARLQAHATQEPIVKPGSIRKVVIGAVLIAACIGLIYLACKYITIEREPANAAESKTFKATGKKPRDPLGTYINKAINKKWDKAMEWTGKQLGRLGENVGEKLAVGAGRVLTKATTDVDEDGKSVLKPIVKEFTGDLGRELVRGIATKGKKHKAIKPKDKNPDLKVLGGSIVKGAANEVKPLVKKITDASSKTTKTIKKIVRKDIKPMTRKLFKGIKGAQSTGQKLLKKVGKVSDKMNKAAKKGAQPVVDDFMDAGADNFARKHPWAARVWNVKKRTPNAAGIAEAKAAEEKEAFDEKAEEEREAAEEKAAEERDAAEEKEAEEKEAAEEREEEEREAAEKQEEEEREAAEKKAEEEEEATEDEE